LHLGQSVYVCVGAKTVCYDEDMVRRIIQAIHGRSFLKFFVVGGLSFLIDYGLLLGLYRVAGVPLALATTIGFLIGLVVNFALNKYWTFDAPRGARHSARQALLYGVLVGVNLIFTDIFIVALANWHLSPEVTKPLATGIIMISNYLLYQKVIFKPHAKE
jgi:putative flippase GtrA